MEEYWTEKVRSSFIELRTFKKKEALLTIEKHIDVFLERYEFV